MRYFDTSFLVPLFLREATSDAVEAALRAQDARDFAISQWTRVEFASLLARQIRMGEISAEAARKADAEFEAVIAESFDVILPSIDDFDLAKAFLARPELGLRSGDALHLAIARGRGAQAVHSLDKAMIRAGEALGLAMQGLG